MISRRTFLQAAALTPAMFVLPSNGQSTKQDETVMICVFQRGAVDGLSMAIPYAESQYYKLRSQISIAPPEAGVDSALKLDEQFALHPALSSFKQRFDQQQLVVVPGCGLSRNSRSHFDAQDFMESGVCCDKQIKDGWMNRVIAEWQSHTPMTAMALTTSTPRILRGSTSVLSIADIAEFEIGERLNQGRLQPNAQAAALLKSLYQSGPLAAQTDQSFEALSAIRERKFKTTDQIYPNSPLSTAFKSLAQLIKSNLGVRFAFLEMNGWDTHANQGAETGQLANRLYQLSAAIEAFLQDLGEKQKNVVLLTMSEFGRTVKQNGNFGTDHGHGTTFFALGAVNGGRVTNTFSGLDKEDLFEQRDVAVNLDYRNVLAEILYHHMGVRDFQKIFPGFEVKQENFAGIMS